MDVVVDQRKAIEHALDEIRIAQSLLRKSSIMYREGAPILEKLDMAKLVLCELSKKLREDLAKEVVPMK